MFLIGEEYGARQAAHAQGPPGLHSAKRKMLAMSQAGPAVPAVRAAAFKQLQACPMLSGGLALFRFDCLHFLSPAGRFTPRSRPALLFAGVAIILWPPSVFLQMELTA